MKNTIRILAVLLAALIICSFTAVMAEGNQLSILDYTVYGDGTIQVFAHAGGVDALTNQNLKVETKVYEGNTYHVTGYDANSVSVNNCSQDLNYGTSWIVIVDVASVSKDKGTEAIQDTVRVFFENKGVNDNFALTAYGYSSLYFINNTKEYESFLEQCVADKDTDPYVRVSEVIDYVAAERNDFKEHVNIVVLSGGQTEYKGISRDALVQKLASSDVTVYTVVYNKDYEKPELFTAYTDLAYASKGGIPVFATNSGVNKADTAAAIYGDVRINESKFYKIKVNPVPQQIIGSELCFTLNGYTVSIPLSEHEQSAIRQVWMPEITLAPTVEPTVEPTIEPTATPSPWRREIIFGLSLLNVLIIGGCVIAAIALVLIIVLIIVGGKKKDDDKDVPAPTFDKNAGGPPESPIESGVGMNFGDEPTRRPTMPAYGNQDNSFDSVTKPAFIASPAPSDMRSIEPTEPDDRGNAPVQITMSQVGGGKNFTAYMGDELFIGRDGRACEVVIDGDGKISGKHMRLSYDGVNMYITDCGSRNGTRVNNKTITQPTMLKQHDVITIGTTSLKITWWVRR